MVKQERIVRPFRDSLYALHRPRRETGTKHESM
jgi:hypothetical protein